MRYPGLVESGDSRSSQSIDDVVYGAKDKTARVRVTML
jgi:hypothetical protein